MKKAISIAFVALLLGTLLLTLVLPDKTFSPDENRMLQTLPSLTLSSVTGGEWMDDMELWLADQFPGRTFFVRTKASLDYLMGKRAVNGTYLGKNGQYFETTARIDENQLAKNVKYLTAFAQAHKVTFLPVYSAYTVYPENLPAFAETVDERALVKRFGLDYIDILPALEAAKETSIFFKTDHHWTQDGAYIAYLAYCEAMGMEPVTQFERVESAAPFYGSLYSKAPVFGAQPDAFHLYKIDREVSVVYDMDETTRTDSLYTMDALAEKDQYVAFLDGNHARVDITTDAGTGRQLIVFKDSFAHALIPFLANHYDEIAVIDLRYYNSPVSQLPEELPGADILFAYNVSWLAQDTNLPKLNR